MRRFLQYSMTHQRTIRAVFLLDGVMWQKTITVLELAPEAVTFRMGRKKPLTIPLADILSCDYARGDHGDS